MHEALTLFEALAKSNPQMRAGLDVAITGNPITAPRAEDYPLAEPSACLIPCTTQR